MPRPCSRSEDNEPHTTMDSKDSHDRLDAFAERKARVLNSKAVIGKPENYYGPRSTAENDEPPVTEGVHYEVHSATVWDGTAVPTLIQWVHQDGDETDDFTDRMQSLDYREVAIETIESQSGGEDR